MVYVQVTKAFNTPLKQDHLENVIKQLFPDHRVIRNARKVGQVVSPYTSRNLELDFLINALNLAFEYQDPYHFGSYRTENSVNARDKSKKSIVEDRGDTLIVVPCWWDGSISTLAATIRAKRPDLLSQYSNSTITIPIAPPSDYIADYASIPNIGALSIPSQFQITNFNSGSWWLNDKHGGIRICWDPRDRKMYFKNGKDITSYFSTILQHMPKETIIDGEIWFGKNDSISITSSSLFSQLLSDSRLLALDSPTEGIIEDRIGKLFSSISFDNPYIVSYFYNKTICIFFKQINVPIMPIEYKTIEKIKDITQKIINSGGFGITLRRAGSEYIFGQSPHFVELTEYPTNEALVVGVLSANSVLLQSTTGDIKGLFTAKIETQMDKLNVGEKIMYICSKRRNPHGLPVDARITHVGENTQNISILPEIEESSRKPYGYWTQGEGKNSNGKLFLDSLAAKKGLDPLDPESWYNITQKEITAEGGGPLLSHYKSLGRMIMSIYPDINLQPNRFRARFWASKENRREFFEKFAQKHSFDPLIARNWYSITTDQVLSQGGKAIIYWYNNSVSKALLDLFPEIGLQLSLFDRAQAKYWKNRDNRRLFFDNFANKRHFDPLIPKNWYPYTFIDITREKGGHGLLENFKNSISRALSDCYNFTMDPSEFNTVPRYYWKDENNRRRFFEKFAAKRGLDHLNPSHWYTIPHNRIIAAKHGISVLNYHQGSLKIAISELFPSMVPI